MNRNNLLSLIALDLVVLVLAAGFIVFRYTSLTSAPPPLPMMTRRASPPPPSAAKEKEPAPQKAVEPPASPKDSAASEKKTRNIGFLYRNSKAAKVEIIGDFNAWVPQPLTRGVDSRWTIAVPIAPGEYAYNFVVDGKPIRDPNNPRTCNVGRGFPNSYLNVKPLTHETEKSK